MVAVAEERRFARAIKVSATRLEGEQQNCCWCVGGVESCCVRRSSASCNAG